MVFVSLQTELLVELFNAAAGVDELLLASIEGMALGADFNRDVLTGGASLYDCAARTFDGGGLIVGMDTFFHTFHLN